jgi:hypothetical protein
MTPEEYVLAIVETFEDVIAEAERPRGGMRVIFAAAVRLPSVIGHMCWWAREGRRVLAEHITCECSSCVHDRWEAAGGWPDAGPEPAIKSDRSSCLRWLANRHES